ncbi:hypothetical protein ACWF9B_00025 [Streptomyces sp. NPDC055089]
MVTRPIARWSAIRTTAPRHRAARRDAQKLTTLQGEATKYTEAAAQHRTTVATVRTEQARRADISEKYPELYDQETKARRTYAVQQKRAAAEQSRARAESAGYHRALPSQRRGGPSAGRR